MADNKEEEVVVGTPDQMRSLTDLNFRHSSNKLASTDEDLAKLAEVKHKIDYLALHSRFQELY